MIDFIPEQWKPIPESNGRYCVSNLGRISHFINGIRRPIIDGHGYYKTTFQVGKRIKHFKIHVLVCREFIGKRPNGLDINHKDAKKSNNSITNLEYTTRSENIKHSYNLGLQPDNSGENNGQSKLKKSDVVQIRNLKNMGWTQCSIARKFGVSTSNIDLTP